MGRLADGVGPVGVVHVVGPELGLEGEAAARGVGGAVLGVGVVEPVAGVEVRAGRGDVDVERAAAGEVLGAQGVARRRAALVAVDAQAVVVAAPLGQLGVLKLDVAAERLGPAEVEGGAAAVTSPQESV